MNEQKQPKVAYSNDALHDERRIGGYLRPEHISQMLVESIESEGGQLKNLKAYVCLYKPNIDAFVGEKERVEGGHENEFSIKTQDYELFINEHRWGIIAYHTQGDDGTRKIEKYLQNHSDLRKPWINKSRFEQLIHMFIENGGKLVGERGSFKPHQEYSGYGISIEVTGRRSKEVFDKIEREYPLHPRKAKIEFGNGEKFRFECTNSGRISFYSGPIDIIILIIQDYEKFIREIDDYLDYKSQPRWIKLDDCNILETDEILNLSLPSLEKTGGSPQERREAIISLLTSGKGTYGFVGIPITSDRASILDLRERKSIEISVGDEGIYLYSENPSDARPAIRNIISEIALHIDPDVEINRIEFGDNECQG